VSRSIASKVQPLLVVGALVAATGGCAPGGGVENGSVREVADHLDLAAMHWLTVRKPPSVSYAGPTTLHGRVTLRAHVRGATPVVAVTFMLGGRPLGTVTSAPWALDVDAVLLTPGKAQLTVTAVDRLGNRGSSGPSTVAVLPGGERVLRASPRRGFGQALQALSTGSVLVHLAPGIYRVRDIVLGPGARLAGSGQATVLTPSSRASGTLLSTHSSHVRMSDLVVRGDWHIDQAISISAGANDVRLQRIGISGVRVNGIEIWGAHSRDSIQDSTLLGTGAATNAGVFELGSVNSSQTSVVRTRISGFRAFGVIFDQRFHGLQNAALHNLALDNRISAIIDPRIHNGTDAGAIWTGGAQAAVIGNVISDTGTDGVETVGSSIGDTIVDNQIRSTPVAIYIEHSTSHSLVLRNQISRSSTGINVEWRHDGGGSNANTFAQNRIAATQAGVFVDVRDDFNSIVANTFVGSEATPIIFQGSSENLARDNVACSAGSQPFVVERPALLPSGDVAGASNNRLVHNVRTNSCTAS
jgi:Right handed beta helix region/Bacterial Ig domain